MLSTFSDTGSKGNYWLPFTGPLMLLGDILITFHHSALLLYDTMFRVQFSTSMLDLGYISHLFPSNGLGNHYDLLSRISIQILLGATHDLRLILK